MEYSNRLFVVADTGTVGGDNTLMSEVARVPTRNAPALADGFRQTFNPSTRPARRALHRFNRSALAA